MMTTCIYCYQMFNAEREVCPSCWRAINSDEARAVEGIWESRSTDKLPSSLRKAVTEKALSDSFEILNNLMMRRLNQKGRGTFASRHEILGAVEEERSELVAAVCADNLGCVERELADIAIACIFGIASIRNGTVEW